MPTKKRKYFKNDGDGLTAINSKAFLLKFIDKTEDDETLKTVGPFEQEDDAIEALSGYLKSGICSWIVSYNG